MDVYPLIASPCPYKGPLSDIVDGDICRLCHKQVHDLSDMTDNQRRAFIKACEGDACVTYRVSARTAAILAALAATAIGGLPAAAQPPAQTHRNDDVVIVIAGGIGRSEPMDIAIPVEVITDFDVVDQPTAPKQTRVPDRKSAKVKAPRPTRD